MDKENKDKRTQSHKTFFGHCRNEKKNDSFVVVVVVFVRKNRFYNG